MGNDKLKVINIDSEVYVYNNIEKRVTKGIVKRANITIQEDVVDIGYTIIIPCEQPYAINMNEDFVWIDKDKIIDFATNLIKDL